MIEATAMGVRWIRDTLVEGGLPVKSLRRQRRTRTQEPAC